MKGADQCPRCASRRWDDVSQKLAGFYADKIRVCTNPACRTAWEPFDPAHLLDPRHEPLGAFAQPCNNCAFRKGSPEQQDEAAWARKMAQLHQGARFYCHKGVPIDPKSDHGFAYPDRGRNPRKLRLCRGYLNAIVGPRMRAAGYNFPDQPNQPWQDEPWVNHPSIDSSDVAVIP